MALRFAPRAIEIQPFLAMEVMERTFAMRRQALDRLGRALPEPR